ncbi:uncharacterized protein Z519_03602 [Cladophialophora bantiana CBS 173.52]|uniref:Major facilitator superfamily (MFS) profile domain-containing protein n=1 Tax=Cladophialophora bantiana (strain ATCC 10958 / CBS 173.52 / CDC B-1940 / NIH 8579) TaxID=1442370 RepID=A0A0D2HSV7_CLAB1|nr:uncharacterized protein Z519_03602 [Cladophialophora bantiana CBS 173.52]KIW96533.1 hypothetical protein Z519_03602 [Cladophialophora bantiana CBS 173.52]
MNPIDVEGNVNVLSKDEALATHAEQITEEERKHEEPTLSKSQVRRFMWRVDLHVLPMLGLIYAVSIIDRINIGSAKVLGMQEDLNLGTQRYSIILMLFFPGYAVSDVPSNWILTKVEPRWWLPFLTFSWGAVLCGMGFLHNWGAMAFLRFLLGTFEGGVLPGITFTIACWYTRRELHKRIAFAYAVGVVASALAGILSYGLGSMGGVRNMNGWRWIFSIEGGASMAIGLIAPLFVPKFPDHTKWIKPDERVYLYNKLDKDRGEYKTAKVVWSAFVETAKDWTLWAQGTIYCFNVGTANATAFFTPTIIKGLGYSGLDASLRSGYPFFAALGLLGITSYLSDKYQKRASVCIFNSIVMIVGFSIMREGFSNDVRYFGIFLATMGVHSNTPALLAFNQSNTIGSAARAVSSGILIACGAIGGIIGSLIFRGQDAPSYGPGIYTTIGLTTYMVIALMFMVYIYWRRNNAADRDGIDIGGIPGFRYAL